MSLSDLPLLSWAFSWSTVRWTELAAAWRRSRPMPRLTVFSSRWRNRAPKRAQPSPFALAMRFFIASAMALGRSPLATALSIAASAAALAAGVRADTSTPSCLANSSRKVWQYWPAFASTARLPAVPVAAGAPGFARTVLISVPPTIADTTSAPANPAIFRRLIGYVYLGSMMVADQSIGPWREDRVKIRVRGLDIS